MNICDHVLVTNLKHINIMECEWHLRQAMSGRSIIHLTGLITGANKCRNAAAAEAADRTGTCAHQELAGANYYYTTFTASFRGRGQTDTVVCYNIVRWRRPSGDVARRVFFSLQEKYSTQEITRCQVLVHTFCSLR
jgi:hypothetical protein